VEFKGRKCRISDRI